MAKEIDDDIEKMLAIGKYRKQPTSNLKDVLARLGLTNPGQTQKTKFNNIRKKILSAFEKEN